MTRLNCPNCGAPIDIHRRSCEYCGTPYDLEDRAVLYADNQPVYIYQEPIKWNDDALNRFNETIKRGIERTSFDICCTEAKLRHIEAQLQAKNLEAWQQELTRQCVNAYPKVESESSGTDCVPGIWDEPVCPENSILKSILELLLICAPFIAFIILKALNVI